MSAEKLVFKPRKPFDVFLNLPHRPNWLPLVDDLRTFFIAPASEIIKYFGWGSKMQNVAFY